jgi:glycogen debranching enzyme
MAAPDFTLRRISSLRSNPVRRTPVRFSAAITFSLAFALSTNSNLRGQSTFAAVPAFALDTNPLVIKGAARTNKPFSVVGEHGAILGQQDGTFELWSLPVKVLHNVHLTAHLAGYDAPIELNDCASSIEVRPDHTTIVYSHAAITVRQHMFVPRNATGGLASAIVLFEIHAVRRAEVTVSFAPSMEREWPAPNHGRPSGSWQPRGTGGAYVLETDDPRYFGVVAMPNATAGPMRPYQERPKTEPLEFHLSYDPAKDDHVFYPLLAAVSEGTDASDAARSALIDRLVLQAERIPELYRETAAFYNSFFDTRLTVTTPDARLNDASRWAEISIQQSRVTTADGAGLAGGWYTSGDSARPGFGWFFGRDTLWSLYAVNSYGDFALSRDAMNFLLAHQRADGKMMHEYSQTAAEVDWASLPYLYAAADTTPLFVMEMEDYVRASGDVAYLRQHWDAVKLAYAFTRNHTTNGIYDNTQGTGWVEEWIPTRPHQEIYLASLDQQSAESISRLAALMKDDKLSRSSAATGTDISRKLRKFRLADGMYAFSRNADGSYEAVSSIFPSVAWWSGRLALPDADNMFDAWSGHRFATDWGTRSVATDAAIYDPISYHHGSVWPLYTGWLAMADYRTGRSLQAYTNLYDDAQLTWLQDPGAITEVISGEFLAPLGRSSSHQLWSSAMLISPLIRGLFGIETDALNRTLSINPQLPAEWDEASVKHVPVGERFFDVHLKRVERRLEIDVSSDRPEVLCLTQTIASSPCTASPEMHHQTSIPLPEIEVIVKSVMAVEGDRTSSLKVVSQRRGDHELTLLLEAPGGTKHHIQLRRNEPIAHSVTVEGGELRGDDISIRFDPSPGNQYQIATVKLHW